MAILETDYQWADFTSTGTGKALNLKGYSQSITFQVETSSGCTATVQIQARMGSSGASSGTDLQTPVAYAVLSTLNLSTGQVLYDQYLGPLGFVKPRVTDKNSGTVRIRVMAN